MDQENRTTKSLAREKYPHQTCFAAFSSSDPASGARERKNARRLRGFSRLLNALQIYAQRTGLHGGACSLLRTRLWVNSLLAGKITGNTVDFDRFYEARMGDRVAIPEIYIEIPQKLEQGIQISDQRKTQAEQGSRCGPQ